MIPISFKAYSVIKPVDDNNPASPLSLYMYYATIIPMLWVYKVYVRSCKISIFNMRHLQVPPVDDRKPA